MLWEKEVPNIAQCYEIQKKFAIWGSHILSKFFHFTSFDKKNMIIMHAALKSFRSYSTTEVTV